jgi:hypothetical protein
MAGLIYVAHHYAIMTIDQPMRLRQFPNELGRTDKAASARQNFTRYDGIVELNGKLLFETANSNARPDELRNTPMRKERNLKYPIFQIVGLHKFTKSVLR